MTTTSAARASRRAWLTWQALKLGQTEPRQFSRVEVTRGMTGERSSSPGSSAKSPVVVAWAHCSTRDKAMAMPRSLLASELLACCMRCMHR